MTAVEWEPGDPLHTPYGVYVRPMAQVIEDSTASEPTSDAARWPEPFGEHLLREATS